MNEINANDETLQREPIKTVSGIRRILPQVRTNKVFVDEVVQNVGKQMIQV